jgi:hypothetical protein
MLGPSAQASLKEKKRKRKENNAETGGSTKTKMTRNCCTLRRIPTTLLALRSATYQETPTIRKAMTTALLPGLILGFPLVRYGEWERGTPRRKGDTSKCHRVGVETTWISSNLKKNHTPNDP